MALYSTHSSHPGGHRGIGVPFWMQVGSCKKALKDKPGWNDLAPTLSMTTTNKIKALCLTLALSKACPC